MKICMVSTHPISGGGVSSYTESLVRSLREHGADVVVFSNKPEYEWLKQAAESVNGTWNRGIFYPFQIFKALAANADIDIVHVQHEFFMYGGMFSALLFPVLLALARLLDKRVVVTIHGVIPLSELNERFKRETELNGPLALLKFGLIFLTRVIVLFSDAVIVHGRFFAEILYNDYMCPKWKINVIPHGVERATTMISQNEAKKRLKVENKIVILFFGYISKYKGIETLIDAFGRVAKKHRNWILILGGGRHPRLRPKPEYEDYIMELQLKARSSAPEQIRFAGFISNEELPLYFSIADILVSPHNTAMSSSGSLALSMGYGKPIVASDIPSIREIIPFEECLFEKNSPEDLRRKLELILNSNDLKHRIVVQVERIREDNSWSKVGLQTYTLYQKVRNLS